MASERYATNDVMIYSFARSPGYCHSDAGRGWAAADARVCSFCGALGKYGVMAAWVCALLQGRPPTSTLETNGCMRISAFVRQEIRLASLPLHLRLSLVQFCW